MPILYAALLVLGSFFGYFGAQLTAGHNAGATLPSATAVFETSLASPLTSSATTMTLTANAVRGGGALSGYNCFTIDEGSAQAETVCGTVSSTAVTNMTRGISQSTGTTSVMALQFSHRRGADVKVTDFPLVQILKAQNNGEETYPNLMTYANTVLISGTSPTTTIATKYYVDNVVTGGAPDSSLTTKGLVEKATASEAGNGAADGSGNTTAPLALTASIATSTCQTPSGYSVLVASTTTGKLDANCMATNGALTYTGNNTFTGTSTFTGAVDILATVLKPLRLNGLFYNFPASYSASSTVWATDGAGNVSAIKVSRALAVASADDVLNNVTSSTTVRTVTLLANTLSTTQTLRITAQPYHKSGSGSCSFGIDLGDGGSHATTSIAYSNSVGSPPSSQYPITGTVMATSSSNQSSFFVENDGAGIVINQDRFSAYNNAGTIYIGFIIKGDGAGLNCNYAGEVVELLSF